MLATASQGFSSGTVTSFDEAAGLGVVTSDDGASYPFHCTAIANGTRTIDVDAPVTFTIVAGHLGRWEASTIDVIGAWGS